MVSQVQSKDDLDQVLIDTFTDEVRTGYITVQGVCMPETYNKYAQAIEDFEVMDDDIWVCSFPKTGTTWTQEMVWCIMNDLDSERAKVPLTTRFPFLEISTLMDVNKLAARNPRAKVDTSVMNSVNFTRNQTSPRYIKSHLPFHLLPRQLRTGEKKPRLVYVVRNPKDTCVSYYYHSKLLEGYRGDFPTFCRLFLGNKLNYTPYWEHVIDFWNRRNEPNILFLKYEDMKADLAGVIKKTAAFLNTSLSDDKMKALLDHLSFTSMQSNPAVNYENFLEQIKLEEHRDGKFIRSGKVNQWKEEMSKDVIDQFDKLTQKKFTPLKLSF